MLVSLAVVKALQISDVPSWVLVRCTSVQVNPAPVTLVTVIFAFMPSVATRASSSSFPTAVVNAGLVTVLEAVDESADVSTSMATLPGGGGTEFVTVRVALLVETYVPEMVTNAGRERGKVVTVKLALNCPA